MAESMIDKLDSKDDKSLINSFLFFGKLKSSILVPISS